MMKTAGRTILFLLIIFTCLSPLLCSASGRQDQTDSFVLDNGLAVSLFQKPSPAIVNITFAVNLGSKDETRDSAGYVHLLEHLLLLGSTQNHSSSDLQEKIRQLGIEYNAYTNQDHISFVLTTLPKNLKQALEFIRNKHFLLQILDQELNRERELILEEIKTIEDNPARIGFTVVLSELFKNHPYGRPVYGHSSQIKKATGQTIETFYKKFFVPANCSLALAGDLNLAESRELINKTFENLPSAEKPVTPPVSPARLQNHLQLEKKMDIKQGHLFIGLSAPPKYHPDQLPFNLLIQIIGRGSSPLINQSLRSNRRINVKISTQYISLIHGGAWIIHIQGDPKFLKGAELAVIRFLNRTGKIGFSKKDYPLKVRHKMPDFIENAKNLMDLGNNRAIERGTTISNHLAVHSLFEDLPKPEGAYSVRLGKIKSKDLKRMASKYLVGKKMVKLLIIPGKKDE